jgi:homoserine O-acetyltransferase
MIAQKKIFSLSKPFITESGETIKTPLMAYEEYGLPDGPVLLITHGGLSSQHAAGKYHESDPEPGFWDGIIGPGKAVDTEKFRVISVNSLGSMHGSSGPMTENPETGKPYGPGFPAITMIDQARFYKAFLDDLDISKIFMAAGPSMGSMQNLQMAALFPDLVGSVVSVATAGRMTPGGMAMHEFIISALKKDPDFEGGYYFLKGKKPVLALKIIHEIARIYYTHEKLIKTLCWDTVPENKYVQRQRSENIRNYLTAMIDEHIADKDPNCYISLLNAINSFNLGRDTESYEKGVQRIKCPVLLMNMDTDAEFPPYWAQEVADILNKKNPGQARMEVIPSIWGHIGCLRETEALGKHISKFIQELLS